MTLGVGLGRRLSQAGASPSDIASMMHIREAQAKLDQGDGSAALAICENILGLAPKNPEALRIKAVVLDSLGRFDDSMTLVQKLSQVEGLPEAGFRLIENRLLEEREASVYSELTTDGRWYFSFPAAQVWVSLFGFIGCGVFLLLSPYLMSSSDRFLELLAAFGVLVLMPWIALLVVHCTGVKKILVGMDGVKVCFRFKSVQVAWEDVGFAVVESHPDMRAEHLRLILYGRKERSPILDFDISASHPIVRARRHFVRSVISYCDVVCYATKKARHVSSDGSTAAGGRPGENDGIAKTDKAG